MAKPLTGSAARLDAAVWDRIITLANRAGAVPLDAFVLRLALDRTIDVVTGDPLPVDSALAIATVRFVPDSVRDSARDSLATRVDSARTDTARFDSTRFDSTRFAARIEDRAGGCWEIVERLAMRAEGGATHENISRRGCSPVLMADVVRRGRRLAALPFSAGDLTDSWSVAAAARGFVDLYADSLVVRLTTLEMRSHPQGREAPPRIDSIRIGIARGDRDWSIVRSAMPLVVAAVVPPGTTWVRQNRRFMIPIDSGFSLAQSWPVIEVNLHAAKTPENPSGLAWTYAHGRTDFFTDFVKDLESRLPKRVPVPARPPAVSPSLSVLPRMRELLQNRSVELNATRFYRATSSDGVQFTKTPSTLTGGAVLEPTTAADRNFPPPIWSTPTELRTSARRRARLHGRGGGTRRLL